MTAVTPSLAYVVAVVVQLVHRAATALIAWPSVSVLTTVSAIPSPESVSVRRPRLDLGVMSTVPTEVGASGVGSDATAAGSPLAVTRKLAGAPVNQASPAAIAVKVGFTTFIPRNAIINVC